MALLETGSVMTACFLTPTPLPEGEGARSLPPSGEGLGMREQGQRAYHPFMERTP